MNQVLLFWGMMFLIFTDGDKSGFYGKYHRCSGGSPKVLELSIAFTENNKFYFTRQSIDAFYGYFGFSGSYKIKHDTIELNIERAVKKDGYSSEHIKETGETIAQTKVYITENKCRNRKRDKKTYFSNLQKGTVGKLEYHDMSELNEKYFNEEFYWNRKLVISHVEDEMIIRPVDDGWRRNALFGGNFCKKE